MASPPEPAAQRLHVITGASAGMGGACVDALASRGDRVVAVARRGDVLVERFVTTENVAIVAADIGDSRGRQAIIDAVAAHAGPITSIIHGAATAVALEPWTTLDPDQLTAHFHVHVASAVALTGALHRTVGVERCVLFDSYSATNPRVGWSAYSILKAASQMAFRAAAAELGDVAIIRAFPGAVGTPLLDRVLDAPRTIEATAVYHELKDTDRVSTPEEIAEQLLAILDRSPDELRATDTWTIGHPA
ncbi:MAG: SDR family NAD(P)-dependent oxidoreductase [Actinomycetota bacterium]